MARKKVPFLGMSTHSSHKDGECRAIVNMRPENGVWKPVAPRKVEQTLSDTYDIVFVHRGNGYENWIGVKNSQNYSTIYKDIKTAPISIGNPVSEPINSVQQIGNTLSFITDSDIYYAIFKNNNYVLLGRLPELPHMRLGTYNQTSITRTYKQEYGSTVNWNSDGLTLTKGLYYKARDVIVNGGRVGEEDVEGRGMMFFDAHLLRYAFRLYDGTVVKHSTPLLIMPTDNILDLNKIKFGIGHLSISTEASYVITTAYNIGISVETFEKGGS